MFRIYVFSVTEMFAQSGLELYKAQDEPFYSKQILAFELSIEDKQFFSIKTVIHRFPLFSCSFIYICSRKKFGNGHNELRNFLKIQSFVAPETVVPLTYC